MPSMCLMLGPHAQPPIPLSMLLSCGVLFTLPLAIGSSGNQERPGCSTWTTACWKESTKLDSRASSARAASSSAPAAARGRG